MASKEKKAIIAEFCKMFQYKPTDGGPGCWLDPDGFCIVHQTHNLAECANAKMNGYTPVNSREEAIKVFKGRWDGV